MTRIGRIFESAAQRSAQSLPGCKGIRSKGYTEIYSANPLTLPPPNPPLRRHIGAGEEGLGGEGHKTLGYAKVSTIRTLRRCDVKRSGPLLTFTIEGDGFLYKMCRGIVGTLVQIGQGKFPPAEIKAMLGKRDRRVAGMTAPAQGLVLWRVFYRKKSVVTSQ